jgi:hypothetical protein
MWMGAGEICAGERRRVADRLRAARAVSAGAERAIERERERERESARSCRLGRTCACWVVGCMGYAIRRMCVE